MTRRPFSLRGIKPINARQLNDLVAKPRSLVVPTMDPIEAHLFNLERIVRKAAANLEAQGVRDIGPEQPRTWRGAGVSHVAWMVGGS